MIYVKRWLEYYNQVFSIEPNQVEFLDGLCKQFAAPAKFLSVEAGCAQASMRLLDLNNDVTITDSYPEFISIINHRTVNNKDKLHAFNLNPMDIIRYLGKGFFNVIYCANYRLIFIKDKVSIQKLMLDSKMMLSDGGYLVLDLINFSKYDFSKPRIDLAVKETENAHLYSYILKDADSMKYRLNQQIVTNDGKCIDEVKDEEITPISLETFKTFADAVGFSSIDFYSDYLGNPLKPDSEKIICVLKK